MARDCPASRRYTIDVGASNTQTVRFGDGHPALYGWEISWQTSHASNYAVVQAEVRVRQPEWFQAARLDFGDTNGAPCLTQGGVVLVPWPWVELAVFDAEDIGGATIELFGRPVMFGESSRASTALLCTVPWEADPTSTTNIVIPENASAYVVTRGEDAASAILIEASGLDNEVFEAYSLDNNTLPTGQLTAMPWRQTPWKDANSNGAISLSNQDDSNAAAGQVYFRFDFARGR